MHSIQKDKQATFALKVDLSKAYDRVNCTFLQFLLIKIGMPLEMAEWIVGCIKSTSFAVLINDSPSNFFLPTRGLRHGYPLSPFLFLLVAESLSGSIHNAMEERRIKGVRIDNQIELTHVLFVDDVLMFGEGTLGNLVEVLDNYQSATGMEINLEKSKLSHNKVQEELLTQAKEIIPISTTPLLEGFKYAGFQLKPNAYSCKDWEWLYKKIENRVSMWTNIFLSRERHLVLLKAVLQSILVYWALISYMPKGILSRIRKKWLSFLWTPRKKVEGIPLVKWTTIVLLKYKGGWGIKNPELFSKALAAKSLWHMIENPESLWERTM